VNVVVLAASLALSVVGGEAATRWFYRDITTTSDFHGYFTQRWLRSAVRHNHYGFRGPEFDEAKPAGTYRVAVLGDSFAYGNGVAEEKRFSDRLEARLASRHVQVLNFGFPGNNWPDRADARAAGPRLKPDFVLLQWGTNDIESEALGAPRPTLPPLALNHNLHEWLYAHSALYSILESRWVQYELRRHLGDSYEDYMQRVYGDPSGAASRKADEWIQRFLDDCRRAHVPLAVVMFPHLNESLADYPLEFLHTRMGQECQEARVPYIDLLERFRQIPDTRTLWASPLDPHPNGLANRLAADEILVVLAPTWGFDGATR
jgi:lysophospholipase L1-like esterase